MKDHFYIQFERSGGFNGMVSKVDIDSRSLDSMEVEEVRKLINQSDFFSIQIEDRLNQNQPDQFHYILSIKFRGKSKTINCGEPNLPESCQPLIHYLIKKSRK
ncbi:MAG TPA: protealysin inhibitor emfourin [Sunxiuqinia sp.]|nr:protealysin inhibitor emfourin [Sunxiuqinia sp.]